MGKGRRYAKHIYAFYDGETYIMEGTAKQIAKRFCIKPETVRFYASHAAIKRNCRYRAVLMEKRYFHPFGIGQRITKEFKRKMMATKV